MFSPRLSLPRLASPRWFPTQLLATALLTVGLAGCGILPLYTRANERFVESAKATRATRNVADYENLPHGVFVGIAMSGGGSRAANFSAAVLFELEELGLLQHASALSSVSGSSLTAAYYGLFDHDPDRWNRERVRDLLGKDFQTRWIWRLFLPHNLFRYWFTDFDRSDIMKGVFDDILFEGKTFDDMPREGPKVLINTTNLTTERGFIISDRDFKTLHSRLDTYPVSDAVIASGAFPGAFNNVTLQNYSTKSSRSHYVHLFDGGPADNLGIRTLLRVLRDLYRQDTRPSGCFIFIVDAYPSERGKGATERDTRKVLDFILDDNVMDSSDVLLSLRREDLLREVGFKSRDIGAAPYQTFELFPDEESTPVCGAWHLTFQRLVKRFWPDLPPGAEEVEKVVNDIPTLYRLQAPGKTTKEAQDNLYRAARLLVREDVENRLKVCNWFRDHGFTDLPCLRSSR